MGLEDKLAQFVATSKYEDLPEYAVEAAKKDILDTLGVGLAGSAALGCKELIDLFGDLEGGGRCSLLTYGSRVSPPAAALINSTMAHALDFDDTHDPAVLHAGVAVVPAALAAAQYLGGIDGRDFVTAVILGIDVMCRMGLATKQRGGWIFTSLYGYFGAAAAAGKLLGLNEDEMLNAWGVAYAQAAGNNECIHSGSLTKRIQPGFAARGGVLSALMAAKGITGAKQSMGGESGIFNLYLRGEYIPDVLIADLGKKFEVANLSFKPYPCCRFTHSAIDAALKLVEECDILPEQIGEITVETSKEAYSRLCIPEEIKHNPRTIVDAQFSTPYVVATALSKRRVAIEDFTEDAIGDAEVRQTIGKLRSRIDSKISQRSGREIAPSRLTVKVKGGKAYSTEVDIAKGHPQNPMSEGEFAIKFRDCARHAVKPLSAGSIDEVINLIDSIEEVDDISQIMSLLT